jgi:hypothetical protein
MKTWSLIRVAGAVVTGPVKATPGAAGHAVCAGRSGPMHTTPVAACAFGIICGKEKMARINTDSTRNRTEFLLN